MSQPCKHFTTFAFPPSVNLLYICIVSATYPFIVIMAKADRIPNSEIEDCKPKDFKAFKP